VLPSIRKFLPFYNFSENEKGVFYMLAASACFAAMTLCVRICSQRLPGMESLFVRSVFDFTVLLFLAMKLRIPLTGVNPRGLLLRGIFGFLGALSVFYSVTKVPVASATALFRSTALFMPFVSYFLLNERLRTARVLCAMVGFIGVLFILKPGSSVFSFGALVALGGGLINALSFATIRHLTETEHPISIVLSFMAVSVLGSGIFFGNTFVSPDANETVLLIIIGVLGLIGQYMLTLAYSHAETTIVTPVNYFEIAFAAFFGWMFLNEVPDAYSAFGTVLLVGAAVSLVRRNRDRVISPSVPNLVRTALRAR
jgi:drug/metabolite transporter (DMT)-like permease